MPSSHLNDPEYWRDHAKEARALAENMADPVSKQKMLEVAANYEHLARRVYADPVVRGRNGPPSGCSCSSRRLLHTSARAPRLPERTIGGQFCTRRCVANGSHC